jgi:hypothetical protein
MTGATSEAETVFHYGAHEFIHVVFLERFVRFAQFSVFCVVFCRTLFVLYHLVTVVMGMWLLALSRKFV